MLFLIRTDIPHAGSENLTDNINFRMHAFMDVVHWNLESEGGYNNKRVDQNNWKKTKWDEENYKFKQDQD